MFNSRTAIFGLALICPILILPELVHTDYAQAADCITKVCIDVYTKDGVLVIEAHKGSAPKAHATKKAIPKVQPKPRPRPRPTVVIPPKPKVTSVYVPPKQVVKKKVSAPRVVRKVAPPVSLNDRLIKLIPTGNIAHEPASDAVVNIPVIYWCDLPGVFSTKVAIIGEAVDVTMRPSFLWSFGDGSFYATTLPGAPYPNQVITHTYKKSGTYAIVLVATWGGTWSNNGVARAITGEIRKVSVATISIANAPTRLTK
jgi:hypothetical protein